MDSASVDIQTAIVEDASSLTELAVRSKSHWPYSPEFIQACQSELQVSPAQLSVAAYICRIAIVAERMAGFYLLDIRDINHVELDALFVEPDCMGQGVGKALFSDARAQCGERGITGFNIQSDPYALSFYLALGAQKISERESGSVPGRMLPLLHYQL